MSYVQSDYPDWTRTVVAGPAPTPSKPTPVTGRVAVGTAETAVSGNGANRTALSVYNPVASTATVYVGFAGVTTATGLPLDPGHGFTFGAIAQVYAIAAAAGTTIGFEDE